MAIKAMSGSSPATTPTGTSRELDELWRRSMDAIGIRIDFRKLIFAEMIRAVNAGTAMMAAEIVGGLWFGSVALIADGLHMSAHAGALLIAALGIVFATMLGFTVGIARLSKNWLVARIAGFYVETIRNIPLLLQLVFIRRRFLEERNPFGGGGGRR